MIKSGGTVHLMGIGGTAMGSLAGILQEQGYQVTGSDLKVYPPMSDQLDRLGIKVKQGYVKENLSHHPDLVIVGNVISKHFEEAEALLQSQIPYTSLPAALGEYVIQDRKSVVIAGTHGKTTTSSMMTWIAESCDLKPGYLIGGIPLNFEKSFRAPQEDWFVIEGDEYDTAFFDKVPKFIHYKPQYVILTGIEFDHADIYSNLDQIIAAFKRLVQLIPDHGVLVANGDCSVTRSILCEATCKVVTYGEGDVQYKVQDRESVSGRNQFQVLFQGRSVGDIAMKQFGPHNTMNALGAFALARELGWPVHKILQGLASFKGVKRRQEVIFNSDNVTVVEDFAHHPTAVRLTIDCMREAYGDRRLICIFEPRSATARRAVFNEQYLGAYGKADMVIYPAAFNQDKIPVEERFDSKGFVSDLKSKGVDAHYFESTSQIVQFLQGELRPNDVVLVMSNGGFDDIYSQIKQIAQSV